MIGDSHAKVVFRSLKDLLKQKGFSPAYVRAENGWSLKKHISKGSLEEIRKARPQTILVSLGGNNQNMTASSYKKTVDQLVNFAKSIGAELVWVGPTTSDSGKAPSTERRHAFTESFLKKYIPKHGKYISMRAFTSSGQGKDGVHYGSSFYKRWAEFVAKRVDLPSNNFIIPLIGTTLLGLTAILGLIVRNRLKGSANVGYINPNNFQVPTPNEIANALGMMIEHRNFDVGSWTGGDCKEIAQSILAITKGKAKIWEIRGIDGESPGIHFYAEYGGLYFNESEAYGDEYGELEHVRAIIKPSRLSNDPFGMEILYAVKLGQMGISSYTYNDFDTWYENNSKIFGFRNLGSKSPMPYSFLVENGKAYRYYDDGVSEIAHGLSKGDIDAIKIAGDFLAKQVTSSDILVPMPSRYGFANTTLMLANYISEISGAKVVNCLIGLDRESVYTTKKQGRSEKQVNLGLDFTCETPKHSTLFILDNVIGTGYTMGAAQRLLPNSKPLVYAVDV